MNVATSSADDTRELGAAVASVTKPGDVVLLAGDLGAGKTTFVQGFGRALGVTDRITSPTFTLMHNYEGRLRLVHVDVYRLDRLQEILDLGITELVDDDAVAVVEWGDVAEAVLPADFLEIRIAYVDGDDDVRRFALRPVGPSWSARASALSDATARWKDGE
ncbi:MAG TPA: tRNA (adenosine(37)-N6)-threonylcarbamoyltransferase complex ATPase subunit type 1 TsaE [Acidimicrobiales bacterium]|nr:tRNA (adenosine(37)-N6)-threonylcarbamoyltransferase complex ATPase subunit type 1 TsaE [Acidimicrobiales bacterium]